MHWEISKSFDFCYGHRVWSQELNSAFSLTGCLACRHLHGHQGQVILHLQSDTLTQGMVTDFHHLNWFKRFLDETLDHKFIIDTHDPLFATLLPHYKAQHPLIIHPEGHRTPDLSILKEESSAIVELYEGYVIVDFVPTSENLCTWLLQIVECKMAPLGVKVSRVEFLETPKSRSVVYA